jgi:hypothetical protein
MVALTQPWRSLIDGIPYVPEESLETPMDVRRNETELRRNDGSELSYGKGIEPPWTTRRAAAQRRYSQPGDPQNPAARYHGLTPKYGEFYPYVPPQQQQQATTGIGSVKLHQFLNGIG